MSDDSLRELAQFAGISSSWIDATGKPHEVSLDVLRTVLSSFGLAATTAAQIASSRVALRGIAADAPLPPLLIVTAGAPVRLPPLARFHEIERYRIVLEGGGAFVEGAVERDGDGFHLPAVGDIGYHRLHIGDEDITLAVAPSRCFTIADIGLGDDDHAPRLWGLAGPVYGLRRPGDGGVGDFTALANAARAAAARGASAFTINPVHALFSAAPDRYSPYAPSSRAFLNPLYADPADALDPGAIARAMREADLAADFAALERLPLIDWPRSGRTKLALFRRLFETFKGCNGPSREDFDRFRAEGGEALVDHARFEALHAHFKAQDDALDDWRNWPSAFHDARGTAIVDFAHAHEEEVSFHLFLQWLAERSLASAQKSCRDAGMAVGLITDFAVGTDAKGSHPWSRRGEMLSGLSVGAPPDLFNANGQSWGIAALCPHAMKPHGYRAFIEALRATMRHAGGVRIDHAMGLARLWVVPEDASPADGAYIAYPADDLFRLIALESWRNRAIVVGEDLGTVEAGFRARLHEMGILGTQVMWFERDDAGFFSSSVYSPNAMATTTTHDLPTTAGWWEGRDIADREAAGVISAEDAARERNDRDGNREALWRTFRHDGLVNGEAAHDVPAAHAIEVAAAFIGRTPSPLAILPLDDALALREQANIPGTVDEYPNWRRRYEAEASALFDDPAVEARLRALARNRSHARP